jgi:hypothetical protein
VQLLGPSSGSARSSAVAAHGGVGVQQRLEQLAVVGVCRGEQSVRREPVRVAEVVVLRSGIAPDSGVGPGQVARLFDRTDTPSMQARDQSNSSASDSSSSTSWCSRSQTPASCHARNDARRCARIRSPAPPVGLSSGSRCRARTRSPQARRGRRSSAAHPVREEQGAAGSTARATPRAGPRRVAAASFLPRQETINDPGSKIT